MAKAKRPKYLVTFILEDVGEPVLRFQDIKAAVKRDLWMDGTFKLSKPSVEMLTPKGGPHD